MTMSRKSSWAAFFSPSQKERISKKAELSQHPMTSLDWYAKDNHKWRNRYVTEIFEEVNKGESASYIYSLKIIEREVLPEISKVEYYSEISSEKSKEVAEFIEEEGLQEPFDLAKDLVSKYIPEITKIRTSLQGDPVTGQWIEILVIVKTELKTLLDAEDALLDEWVDSTNPSEGQRVRIDYKFAE